MIAPATRAERSRAGRNGARSRHGACLVYVDGVPYDKAKLAKKHRLTIDLITGRERTLRESGRRITLAALIRPQKFGVRLPG